jgi:cytochrome c oxidase cbb3-type subunit III
MAETPAGKQQDPGIDPDTGHDYDGIREFDNRLPNWWLATLILTVIFGYGYWFYYHVLEGPSTLDEYRAELSKAAEEQVAFAKARGGVTDDTLRAMAEVTATLQLGEATYKQMCASCHGAEGQGLVGPNLTDPYFLHGSKPTQIHAVVKDGVAAKGMPAWGPVLGAEKVESVTAYLLTLMGKNVAGREPQGEKDEG